MKVNIERIHSRLEEIYQCGRKEDGTFTRMAYSPEDVKGRETFMNYFRKLGIEPRVDEAGNIHALFFCVIGDISHNIAGLEERHVRAFRKLLITGNKTGGNLRRQSG